MGLEQLMDSNGAGARTGKAMYANPLRIPLCSLCALLFGSFSLLFACISVHLSSEAFLTCIALATQVGEGGFAVPDSLTGV